VGRRRPILNVDHENRQHYGAGDEHHREEDVLADERRGERRRRVDLDDEQQEDVERVEGRDGHRYLLAGNGRHIEDEKSDRTDGDARHDEVHGVEQRLASDRDVERDVGVRLRAARIVVGRLLRPDREQVPLVARLVVVQVDSVFHNLDVFFVVQQALVSYSDRVLVVRPRADLDRTRLLVEREELDVDRTQALVDRRRLPDYESVEMDRHLRFRLHRKVAVSAVIIIIIIIIIIISLLIAWQQKLHSGK